MTGRSPARLLAPLALAVAAVALFAVVSSSREAPSASSGAGEPRAATATATAKHATPVARRRAPRTYTIQPGDTPSAIAQKENVDLSALLQANPDADASALTPGQKLGLP